MSKTKISSNENTGAEEIVAPISLGDLKYCKGVASIRYPQAVYNPRSAIIKNDIITIMEYVYILIIFFAGNLNANDCTKNNRKGIKQI